MNKKRLGELLTEQGVLSREQLDETIAEQGQQAERLGESLVAKGLVSKADIGAAIECIKGVAYLECPPEQIDPAVLARVPADVAARCCALPVSVEGKTLIVAMGEPQNVALLEELEFCTGMTISPRFSFRSDVVDGLRTFYGDVTVPEPEMTSTPSASPEAETTTVPAAATQKPVKRGMTWPARIGVFCALSIAALVGWSSGTVVQQAVARLVDDPNSSVVAVSGEETVNSSAARSETTTLPSSDLPSLAPTANSGPDVAVHSAQPLAVEPEATATELVPRAGEAPLRPAAGGFGATIQVGVFRDPANGERLVEALREDHDQVSMLLLPTGLHAVRMGPFPDKQTADRIAQEIQVEFNLSPLVLRTRL